jgi:hypothetical protein
MIESRRFQEEALSPETILGPEIKTKKKTSPAD